MRSRPVQSPSILFCGKHRVNFAMFNPVYQAMRNDPALHLYLSTGQYRLKPFLGWRNPKKREELNENLFGEFGVDPAHFTYTSHRDIRPYDVFVTSNKSTRLQPPNCRTAVQIFHGVSFRNFAVSKSYIRYDKLFFPGRYMMEQYIARGYLQEGDPRIELMGMPKLDRLVDGTIEREDVLRKLGLDPANKTILWCPTGAHHNSFEVLGHEGLKAIAGTGFNLILKLHDHPHLARGVTREQVIDHARAGLGERAVLEDHSDVAPLLVAADILISDASSVAYEYCVLDRPIIFVDVPELIQFRASMEGSNIDQETHGRKMGRIVRGAEEMKQAVIEELGEPGRLSAARRAAAAHIFHEPGGATQRMAARLKALASG